MSSGARKRNGVSITKRGDVSIRQPSLNPRTLALLAGELSVEELSPQELARGYCMNEDGTWPKVNMELIPKPLYQAMQRELFRQADDTLKENLTDIVTVIVNIAKSSEVDASTRLKASQWIFERLRGKTPDVLEITQEKPFQVTLNRIHRGPRPGRTGSGTLSDDDMKED